MTDTVLLLVDNRRGAYERAMELARTADQEAPGCNEVAEGTWAVGQARRFILADYFKDWLEQELDEPLPGDSLRGELLHTLANQALAEVDWHAVADHYLTKLAEQRAHA